MILIILIGCPCSGKSFYAKQKEQEGFVRISQDDQGKKEHFNLFEDAIYSKKNVVIDRMNFNKKQRRRYIFKARDLGYTVHFVEFLIPYEICFKRALARTNHPTIKDIGTYVKVAKFFWNNYEIPNKDEYDTIEVIK